MRKIIVDYQKLNIEVLDLLIATYPDGYGDEDIISYRNAEGEIIECVRVNSEDTIYLVKISKRLVLAMEDHGEDTDEDENEDDLGDSDDAFSTDELDIQTDESDEDSDDY